jgi:hypothetical protein
MRDQHICTSAKNGPLQGSRFCGAYPCLVHTRFLFVIQRKQQPQGREAPLWGAAKSQPCCFLSHTRNMYAPNMGPHHKICCPGGANFRFWCIYAGPSLVTSCALKPGFMGTRTPHEFKSNDWIKSMILNAHTGTRRLVAPLETMADTLEIEIPNLWSVSVVSGGPHKTTSQVHPQHTSMLLLIA